MRRSNLIDDINPSGSFFCKLTGNVRKIFAVDDFNSVRVLVCCEHTTLHSKVTILSTQRLLGGAQRVIPPDLYYEQYSMESPGNAKEELTDVTRLNFFEVARATFFSKY